MKKIIQLLVFALAINAVYAQTWSMDKSHSKVGFTVTHNLIAEVDGNFKTITAKITSVKEDFSDAVFEMTADVSSVDTDNEMRDKDLKSPGFFDAEKFPSITFKSTSIKKGEGNKYTLTGDLTIRDVTKSITMDLTITGPREHPRSKKMLIGVKATATINRKDFNVAPNFPEMGVANEVMIRATGEFSKD
jgi:polyisoprenoid-binding protein YceI